MFTLTVHVEGGGGGGGQGTVEVEGSTLENGMQVAAVQLGHGKGGADHSRAVLSDRCTPRLLIYQPDHGGGWPACHAKGREA